jgi:hypothetical protein
LAARASSAIKPFELDVSIHNVAQHPKTVQFRAIRSQRLSTRARPIRSLVRCAGGRTFALGEKKNLVGRSEDCEVWLDFPSISGGTRRSIPQAMAVGSSKTPASRNGVVG